MLDIPNNYFSNLSSYEEFAIKANLLGYDVSNPSFWDDFSKITGMSGYVIIGGKAIFIANNGKIYVPKTYDGNLNLNNKGIITLEGLPSSNVSGTLDVSNNLLESLKGCTAKVAGSFYCDGNKLVSLEGGPTSISHSYFCNNNKLESLKGCPQHIGLSFNCSYNNLTSLEGGPIDIGHAFVCSYNPLLSSLKGAPRKIDGFFACCNCNLSRKQIDDYLAFLDHPTSGLMDETRHYCPKEEV